MKECSPGINVIQAFQCQLAKLGSRLFQRILISRINMGDMEEEFTVEKVLLIAHEAQLQFNSAPGDRQESWEEWEDGVLAQMARLRGRGTDFWGFGL